MHENQCKEKGNQSEEEVTVRELANAIRIAEEHIKTQSIQLTIALNALCCICVFIGYSVYFLVTLTSKSGSNLVSKIGVFGDPVAIAILCTFSAVSFSFIAYILLTFYILKSRAVGELKRITRQAKWQSTGFARRPDAGGK